MKEGTYAFRCASDGFADAFPYARNGVTDSVLVSECQLEDRESDGGDAGSITYSEAGYCVADCVGYATEDATCFGKVSMISLTKGGDGQGSDVRVRSAPAATCFSTSRQRYLKEKASGGANIPPAFFCGCCSAMSCVSLLWFEFDFEMRWFEKMWLGINGIGKQKWTELWRRLEYISLSPELGSRNSVSPDVKERLDVNNNPSNASLAKGSQYTATGG